LALRRKSHQRASQPVFKTGLLISRPRPTQAAIDALVAQLKGNDDAIADAVTANTPAAPGCLDGFTIQRAPDLAAP
jgi:hypothetical protein